MDPSKLRDEDEATSLALRALYRSIAFYEWELKAREHPAYLIAWMKAIDEKTGESFSFNMFSPEKPWYWQRAAVDILHENQVTLWLKSRQLGITWLCGAYGLAVCLTNEGTRGLIFRQKEEEAVKVVNRIWDLYQSLPAELRMQTKVITPRLSERPTTEIALRFPSGKISRIIAMSSSSSSGHGETAAWVLLDEFAWFEKASDTLTATLPVIGKTGKAMIVSTSTGPSNEETGDGNMFHRLWITAKDTGIVRVFLPWSLHPDRDQHWYNTAPEVQALPRWKRAQQYPSDPYEAFSMSAAGFFDDDDIDHYRANVSKIIYRCDFRQCGPYTAKLVKRKNGSIAVYREPDHDHAYAIGVDTATGRGLDYSVAYVVDLSSLAICAEIRSKATLEDFSEQLHYLGRWYSHDSHDGSKPAVVAIERAGGYGDALIVAMRDGTRGRPPYPRLYRHRQFLRPDQPQHSNYGFPMSHVTRPQVLSYLREIVSSRSLPDIPSSLLSEMPTFVRYNPAKPNSGGTWPRAMDGCHDDCIMAAAIALEMYRQYGARAKKVKLPFSRPREKVIA